MNILRFLPLSLIVLLVACNRPPALPLPEDKQILAGVWEYQGSDPDQGILRNEMLLLFHPNGTVSYKRCFEKTNSHSYTSLPMAHIIEIDNSRIVIAQDFWFTDIRRSLEIRSWPFQKAGHWQMNVNGLLLKKLNEGEKSRQQWACEAADEAADHPRKDVRF